jgi:hypothetical protein
MRTSWPLLALTLTGCLFVSSSDGDGGDAATGGAGSPSSGGADTSVGGSSPSSGGAGGSVDVALTREWALTVAVGTEFGGDNTVVRWTRPPTLSIIEGTPEGSALIEELVPSLSALMPDTPIELVSEGDTSADIDVYFVDFASFDSIGDTYGFPVEAGNLGYFYMFWDGDGALSESYVLIASDLLFDDELRHFTFEEVTQSLGLATDSPIYANSIFFSDGIDGGAATELSGLDERLVRLLYTYGEPGDDAETFGAKFDAFFFE